MKRQVNFNITIPRQVDNKITNENKIRPLHNIKKFYYYISKRIDNWGYYIFCI
jgi:hypothetical protein